MCLLLQRDGLIFSLCSFSWKNTLLVGDVYYKLTKVNYSDIYFTYGSCDGDIQASFEKYRRWFPSRWHGSRVFSTICQRFIAESNLQTVQLITAQGITSLEKKKILLPTLPEKGSCVLF